MTFAERLEAPAFLIAAYAPLTGDVGSGDEDEDQILDGDDEGADEEE